MAGKRQFRLVRMLPNGAFRTQEPLSSVRHACQCAVYVLTDNTNTSKAHAQQFAAQLHAAPLGEIVTHKVTGYAFRIEAI